MSLPLSGGWSSVPMLGEVIDPASVDLVAHIAQRDLLLAACVVVVSIVAGYIIAVNA